MNAILLGKLYDQQPWTVDCLPHSDEEKVLVDDYNASEGTNFSKREIYFALMNMRKRGKLHPKGRKNAL